MSTFVYLFGMVSNGTSVSTCVVLILMYFHSQIVYMKWEKSYPEEGGDCYSQLSIKERCRKRFLAKKGRCRASKTAFILTDLDWFGGLTIL